MISYLYIAKDELKGTYGFEIGSENIKHLARRLFSFSFMENIPEDFEMFSQ